MSKLTKAQRATLIEALTSVLYDKKLVREEIKNMDYETAMLHLENYDGYLAF